MLNVCEFSWNWIPSLEWEMEIRRLVFISFVLEVPQDQGGFIRPAQDCRVASMLRAYQWGNRANIVNGVEWLWNPDSFVICFCGSEGAQRSIAFLAFLLYSPIKKLL